MWLLVLVEIALFTVVLALSYSAVRAQKDGTRSRAEVIEFPDAAAARAMLARSRDARASLTIPPTLARLARSNASLVVVPRSQPDQPRPAGTPDTGTQGNNYRWR